MWYSAHGVNKRYLDFFKHTHRVVASTYICDVVWCDGQKVDLVGHAARRLDGGYVRVDKDRLNAFLLQSLDRL